MLSKSLFKSIDSSYLLAVLTALLLSNIACSNDAETAEATQQEVPVETPAESTVVPTPSISVDRGELVDALLQGRYEELDQKVGAALADAVQDVAGETNAAVAIGAFGIISPGVDDALEAWTKKMPQSLPARLALANHLFYRGWKERGQKWASETKRSQFLAFERYLERAETQLDKALSLDPESVDAYGLMINLSRGFAGREAAIKQLCSRALELRPASFWIYSACATDQLPRWGGSYGEVRSIADQAQEHVAENPRLRSLLGFVDWDRGRVAHSEEDYQKAVHLFSQALESGESSRFYSSRASTYIRLKDYDRALDDLKRALELWPQDPEAVGLHARIASIVGDFDAAESGLAALKRIDPNPETSEFTATYISEALVRQASKLPKERTPESLEQAEALIDRAERLVPDSPWGLLGRSRIAVARKQFELAESKGRECLSADPDYMQCYRHLDWLLARTKRWDEIAALWDDFLARNPEAADAYMERAGTHRQRQDMKAAHRDLVKACDLGNQQACSILKR